MRKSLRDMVYTSAFGGVFESIDQILLSRHFHPDDDNRIGEMEYFSALNDHLTDGSHPETPYNKLASDHGQIIAHMRIGEDDETQQPAQRQHQIHQSHACFSNARGPHA